MFADFFFFNVWILSLKKFKNHIQSKPERSNPDWNNFFKLLVSEFFLIIPSKNWWDRVPRRAALVR